MLYFCRLCSNDFSNRSCWYDEIDLPTHLEKVHSHRLRTIKEIEKDWKIIGLLFCVETEEDLLSFVKKFKD